MCSLNLRILSMSTLKYLQEFLYSSSFDKILKFSGLPHPKNIASHLSGFIVNLLDSNHLDTVTTSFLMAASVRFPIFIMVVSSAKSPSDLIRRHLEDH